MNKQVRWTLLGLILLTAIIVAIRFSGGTNVIPGELLRNSIENTINCDSYRFRMEAKWVRDGSVEVISKVEGKRVAPDRSHLKGTLVSTPIEIVQIGQALYMKDPFVKRWIKLESDKIATPEALLVELNPLGSFHFNDVSGLEYKGEESITGKRMHIVELYPQGKNSFLGTELSDIFYKLWIGKDDLLLHHAIVEAKSAHDEKTNLVVTLELWDYNSKMIIEPPEL